MNGSSVMPATIDDYLSDLRGRLRRVPDADDLVAEVEDHLRAARADLMASNDLAPGAAEQQAMREYGPPAQVATGFRRGARQGGAIPTRFTRFAGLAAMATPLMLLVGTIFNRGPAKGPVHGTAVFLQVASYVTLVIAIVGLVRRHGGLGRVGWLIIGLLVAAPALIFVVAALPSWAGWLGFWPTILALVAPFAIMSVGLYRAAILPRPAVLLLFSAPAWYLVAALVITLAGGDAGSDAGSIAATIAISVALAALAWFGWAMWREPSLNPVTGDD
jgi:hypothetical protein